MILKLEVAPHPKKPSKWLGPIPSELTEKFSEELMKAQTLLLQKEARIATFEAYLARSLERL